MALNPQITDNEIFNSVSELGATQQISVTSASTLTTAIRSMTVNIYATSDIWVVAGSSPTAVANDGNTRFVPAYMSIDYKHTVGEKLAIIRDSADGTAYVSKGR